MHHAGAFCMSVQRLPERRRGRHTGSAGPKSISVMGRCTEVSNNDFAPLASRQTCCNKKASTTLCTLQNCTVDPRFAMLYRMHSHCSAQSWGSTQALKSSETACAHQGAARRLQADHDPLSRVHLRCMAKCECTPKIADCYNPHLRAMLLYCAFTTKAVTVARPLGSERCA